jgi:hypothetical protein
MADLEDSVGVEGFFALGGFVGGDALDGRASASHYFFFLPFFACFYIRKGGAWLWVAHPDVTVALPGSGILGVWLCDLAVCGRFGCVWLLFFPGGRRKRLWRL